jgi:lipopolysaccharide transport system ATP-binding protein
MNPAVRIRGLSKQYRLGIRSGQHSYKTLREAISAFAATSWQRGRRLIRGNRLARQPVTGEPFYALKDVDLDMQPGEVVGIIGRNGAGKSTLLKILSRITEPSAGRVEVRGRIASLLEVGTGFHPELTGRENIYLNGSILGMTRQEIDRKFDDIVAFSEIERFLDTPVKRYSSGMYVRLAFAIAAHLEPEVLIVDEVLAVGDVEFQRKCLGKMQAVGRQGRTVLFVSHNMSALQSLCRRGVLLQNGRVTADAPIDDAVQEYLKSFEVSASFDLAVRSDRKGLGDVRVLRVEVSDGDGQRGTPVTLGRPVQIAFHLSRPLPGLKCVFTITDQHGYSLAKFNSALTSRVDVSNDSNPCIACAIDEWLLAPARYRIDVLLHANGEMQDQIDAAAFFDVQCGPVRGREPPRSTHDWKLALPHRWSVPR